MEQRHLQKDYQLSFCLERLVHCFLRAKGRRKRECGWISCLVFLAFPTLFGKLYGEELWPGIICSEKKREWVDQCDIKSWKARLGMQDSPMKLLLFL